MALCFASRRFAEALGSALDGRVVFIASPRKSNQKERDPAAELGRGPGSLCCSAARFRCSAAPKGTNFKTEWNEKRGR